MNAMAELGEECFEFFFHRIAPVIGADCYGLLPFRTAAGNATNDLDAAFVNNIGREWGQLRILSEAQYCARFKSANVVFSDYQLR
jgi:hypothetical protein